MLQDLCSCCRLKAMHVLLGSVISQGFDMYPSVSVCFFKLNGSVCMCGVFQSSPHGPAAWIAAGSNGCHQQGCLIVQRLKAVDKQ